MIIQRTLAVLSYLAHHPGPSGVREIASALDASPSSIFRILTDLTECGYAQHDAETGRYSIGAQAVQLGIAAMAGLDLTTIAPKYLRQLSDESGETSFLAVLDEGEIVYLAKVEGSFAIRTFAQLGTRRPAHCTALGKAMLAALPDEQVAAIIFERGLSRLTPSTITEPGALRQELEAIRERGYAVDREEIEVGLICVASAIFDHVGNLAGAISLAGPSSRMSGQVDALGGRTRWAAGEISAALGYGAASAPRARAR
jgi:IclR family transcriptional regulator, KDG regulon repressor